MPREASIHGTSAPFKSKVAMTKSNNKATPQKEACKAASKSASKPTAAVATQGVDPRRSRSRSLSPDDRPSPRFAYRDHSPGAESPDFDIPMITGTKPDEDTTGSTKDPTPSQEAPSQNASVYSDLSASKAFSTGSPAKNLTVAEEPSITKRFRSLFDSSDEDEEEEAVTEPQEISNDLGEQQEHYQAAQLQGASE
ncbi:Hypothetical protein PHPALM_7649, partial [Phytophthora palmivora]